MLKNDDYEWLFRKSPAMATSIGPDGAYVDVNDALLMRLGFTRDEMVGNRPVDFVTPESAERIEKEFLPALRHAVNRALLFPIVGLCGPTGGMAAQPSRLAQTRPQLFARLDRRGSPRSSHHSRHRVGGADSGR